MTNDTFPSNKSASGALMSMEERDTSALDALFSDARNQEPTYADANFNKIVLNSLPARPGRQRGRSWVFDAAGLLIGLFACYFFFDFGGVATSVLSFIPESLTLTVANVAAMVVGLVSAAVGAALLAWWTTDKAIL